MDTLTTALNLHPGTALAGSRIDFEARTVYLYLRTDATAADRQRLRKLLLESPVVTGVEP